MFSVESRLMDLNKDESTMMSLRWWGIAEGDAVNKQYSCVVSMVKNSVV